MHLLTKQYSDCKAITVVVPQESGSRTSDILDLYK